MKDDGPFRHTLTGLEPTLASSLKFRGQQQIYITSTPQSRPTWS